METYIYKKVGGRDLHMLFWPGAVPDAPLVYCIHGGGWNAGTALDDGSYFRAGLSRLFEQGWAMASVEYRLTSEQGVHFDELFSDVLDGLVWLAARADELGIDARRVVTAGGSAGGHLSLMTAAAAPQFVEHCPFRVVGCVDQCGPADLTDMEGYEGSEYWGDVGNLLTWLAGVRQAPNQTPLYRRASPYYYITPQTPPLFIVHGTVDTVVPFHQSQKLYERAHECGVPAVLVPVQYGWHDGASRINGKRAVPDMATVGRMASEWILGLPTD